MNTSSYHHLTVFPGCLTGHNQGNKGNWSRTYCQLTNSYRSSICPNNEKNYGKQNYVCACACMILVFVLCVCLCVHVCVCTCVCLKMTLVQAASGIRYLQYDYCHAVSLPCTNVVVFLQKDLWENQMSQRANTYFTNDDKHCTVYIL